MKKVLNKVWVWGIYVLFALLMVLTIRSKQNLHLDEYFSFLYANRQNVGTNEAYFEDGQTYSPSGEIFLDALTVSPEHRFDYANIWGNLFYNVHPPMYYIFLHTVCSIFPGTFSIWYPGILNIIFGLLVLFVVRQFSRLYLDDEFAINIIALSFALSTCFLSVAVFFRMYMLSSLLIAIYTYYLIGYDRDSGMKKLTVIAVVTACTAITHYYALIYIIICSVVYCLNKLIEKKYKTVISYSVAMGIAAVAAVGAFPIMIRQFIKGDRGQEAIKNLAGNSNYLEAIVEDAKIVIGEIFCGAWWIWLLVIVAGVVYAAAKKQKTYFKEWAIIGTSIVIYFFAIARMAPYKTDRYFFPAFVIIVLLALVMAIKAITYVKEKKLRIALMVSFVIMVAFFNYTGHDVRYLYKSSEHIKAWDKDNSELNALVIYGKYHQTYVSYFDAKNFNSVTMVQYDNLEKLPDKDILVDGKLALILVSIDDQEPIVEQVMAAYGLENCTSIGASARNHVYFLE